MLTLLHPSPLRGGAGVGGLSANSPPPGSLCSPALPARGRATIYLQADVADEFVGRALAPLADQRFLRGEQVARGAGVQPVGVGPALVHAAPRIGPVVV